MTFPRETQARIMHKFSTAATKSSALPVLRDPQAGTPQLLNVLKSTFAGADPWRVPLARLVRSALSSLRDKNLCIIRASLLAIGLFYVTVSFTPLSATGQDEGALRTEAGTWPSQSSRLVRFANDALTVEVKDAPLEEVLREVARQSGLSIVWYGTISESISISFQRLSLEKALTRILRNHSFALAYSQAREGPSKDARLRELWIIPKGAKGAPVPSTVVVSKTEEDLLREEATDFALLRAALRSDDSWEREDAVEALAEIGRPEAVQFLRPALRDEDEDVREAAIAALANIGGDEAALALAIVLQDEDEWFREEAVEALGEIGGESAIRLLEQALEDENEDVREIAADLLEELRENSSERP